MDVRHVDEHHDGRRLVTGRTVAVEPRFVDSAPAILEPGVVYVSIRHRTALHLCACGCGNEVVTPLAPHRWQLVFDGETVSLEPSVGNSVLACRSHYFITRNRIDWRRPMTEAGIEWARSRDARALARASGVAEVPDDELAADPEVDDAQRDDLRPSPGRDPGLEEPPAVHPGVPTPESLRSGWLRGAARRFAAGLRRRPGQSS